MSLDAAPAEPTHRHDQASDAPKPVGEAAAESESAAQEQQQAVDDSMPVEEAAAMSAAQQHQGTAGELPEVASHASSARPALERLSSKRHADRAWSDSDTPLKRQELDQAPSTSASPAAAAGDTLESDSRMPHALASNPAATADDRLQLPLKRQELDQPSSAGSQAAETYTGLTKAVSSEAAAAAGDREQSLLKRQKLDQPLSTNPFPSTADDEAGSAAADANVPPVAAAQQEDASTMRPEFSTTRTVDSDNGRTPGSDSPAHDPTAPALSVDSPATGDEASGSGGSPTVAGPVSPVPSTQPRTDAHDSQQDVSQIDRTDDTGIAAGLETDAPGATATDSARSQTSGALEAEAEKDAEAEAELSQTSGAEEGSAGGGSDGSMAGSTSSNDTGGVTCFLCFCVCLSQAEAWV